MFNFILTYGFHITCLYAAEELILAEAHHYHLAGGILCTAQVMLKLASLRYHHRTGQYIGYVIFA